MEARPQLEQGTDAPAHVDSAARRRNHAGDDLEQGRFAGAVLADDAERFARGEIERNLVERAEGVRHAAAAQQIEHQADAAGVGIELGVVLADAGKMQQRRRHQTKSSKCGDSRRNTQRPPANNATATTTATASPHPIASRPSSNASRSRSTR